MPKAVVVGNAALDELFSVARLPRPGESILGGARHVGLGGKGANQAIALARTGIETTFVFAIAEDWAGDLIQEALAKEPVKLRPVHLDHGASDRSLIFQQPGGDNQIITTHAAAHALPLDACLTALSRTKPSNDSLDDNLDDSRDVLLLQGNLTLETTASLIAHAKSQNRRVIFNPSPYQSGFNDLLADINVLFLNTVEARLMTGKQDRAALEALLARGPDQVVMTQGADGVLLTTPKEIVHIEAVPANRVDVTTLDVTGAGDCFEGVTVGSSLRRGDDIDARAVRHGVQAASIAISRLGAASSYPSEEELRSLCRAAY